MELEENYREDSGRGHSGVGGVSRAGVHREAGDVDRARTGRAFCALDENWIFIFFSVGVQRDLVNPWTHVTWPPTVFEVVAFMSNRESLLSARHCTQHWHGPLI